MRSTVWAGRDAQKIFPELAPVAHFGYLGVELFFLISGFVILMSAWGRRPGDFAVSRVVRIYPAYWFSVLLGLVLFLTTGAAVPYGPDDPDPVGRVLPNLTMLQEGIGVKPLEVVYWTLWVELHFYVLVALLAWRGITYNRCVTFMVSWLLLGAYAHEAGNAFLEKALFPTMAPYFIGGMAFYLIHRYGPNLVLGLVIGACWALGVHYGVQGISGLNAWPGVHEWVVPTVVTALYLIMALVATRRLAWLSWRGFTILGALTYPLYLLHEMVARAIVKQFFPHPILDRLTILPVITVAVLLAAYLVHRLVEVPLQALMRPRLKAALAQIRRDGAPASAPRPLRGPVRRRPPGTRPPRPRLLPCGGPRRSGRRGLRGPRGPRCSNLVAVGPVRCSTSRWSERCVMLGAEQRRWLAALVAGVLLLAGCAETGTGGRGKGGGKNASAAPSERAKKPNIVYVLTDDLSWDLVDYMPNVKRLQRRGLTFSNYFVADTLCCPSRATILTGKYPHNTGVLSNDPPFGGFDVFNAKGNEQSTFAAALQKAGYRTALMGKYLNGYEPTKAQGSSRTYIPPGWSEWQVTGLGYANYNYNLNGNGTLTHYGRKPGDYLNTVLGAKATDFVNRSADSGQPFLLQMSTFTPHAPATPAPEDGRSFANVRAPRPPGFNEPDISDKPGWLRKYPRLRPRRLKEIDAAFRQRVRAVQSVDRMIGQLEAAVNARGAGADTYFVFNSDNGYHLGQHRLREGKLTAYDTDIRVPLVVAGPGVPAGRTEARFAQNTDICPTFQELAGLRPPDSVDGRSLVPLLHGQQVNGWRSTAFIEHRGPNYAHDDPDLPRKYGGNPPTYEAVRTAGELYVEYENGDREYYDLARDPHELGNMWGQAPASRKAELRSVITSYRTCGGPNCRDL
ncbi:sulfatase-like hydrolase/transferase [Actinomadura sp. J1-007]